MNFVLACAEMIGDFRSLADYVSGQLWLYSYHKTYTNYR